jgi:DNA-binding NtrC family response regulator
MKKDFLALLVFAQPEPLSGLQEQLQRQSVRTHPVRSYTEAEAFVRRERKPDIIFTDTFLPDGTWADVLRMARKEQPSAEVVVTSRLPDTKLYLDVMESGGFDFVAAPYSRAEVAHVLENATSAASKRGAAQLGAAASRSGDSGLPFSAKASRS